MSWNHLAGARTRSTRQGEGPQDGLTHSPNTYCELLLHRLLALGASSEHTHTSKHAYRKGLELLFRARQGSIGYY